MPISSDKLISMIKKKKKQKHWPLLTSYLYITVFHNAQYKHF